MTNSETRALKYQTWIEKRLARIDRDWKHIARYLYVVYSESLYEEFDMTFEEWAKSIGLSRSVAYDLVAIQNSPYREKLETLDISHARLVLPHLKDAGEFTDPNDLIDAIKDMTWEDARDYLQGDSDPQPHYIIVICPKCNRELKASRAVRLEAK